MSNGNDKKKPVKKATKGKPRYHQIPDDIPPKRKGNTRNLTRKELLTELKQDEIRKLRAYNMKRAVPGPVARTVIKTIDTGVNAVKKHITNPIAKKQRAARKKREIDARAQRDADLLRGMDTVKKQKKKSGQGG